MKLLIKPKPNKKYFDLPSREATKLAWELAKDYGIDGNADMDVFREFAVEHGKRQKQKGQLAFFNH